ncbi:hypothetical protein [Janthinobacterium sp. ZB1P44]|uniref:hypothetical protein n=1 Tax=Janthinobacterium sp. ZB1P44 TaxID=3424192 RepID=UPI003F528EF2
MKNYGKTSYIHYFYSCETMFECMHEAVPREVSASFAARAGRHPEPERQAKKSPLRERAESISLEEDRGDR